MTERAEDASSFARSVFRWRSYIPLLAIVGLCAGLFSGRSAPPQTIRICVAAGLLLAAVGLLLRLYSVGHAPPGTSGRHRKQHAALLNTFGIYSVLRHPLYLGNMLIWFGASLTSGWLAGAAVSGALGIAVFRSIVRHEDAFLEARFGSDFEEWARVTPSFVPRLGLWRTARRPFRLKKAVASEYSTLHSIGILTLLFAALRGAVESGEAPGTTWWALFAANSAVYLALRAWRARRVKVDPAISTGFRSASDRR